VHRRGRIQEAERLYRRIVAEHPTDPEGWRSLADLLYHSNPLRGRSITAAREPLTRLLSLTPDDPEALIYLARIASLEGQEDEADTLVRRAVALTPDSLLLDLRAFRAFALGDPDDARATVELLSGAGVVRRATLAVAVYWGDLAGTEYVARRLARSGPSCEHRSLGYRMLAQVAVARGRPRDARASLHEAESCGVAAALARRAAYAVLPFLTPDTTEVVGMQEELEQAAADDPAMRAYTLGILALRIGDSAGAQRAQAELAAHRAADASAPRENYLGRSLSARLALAQGRPRVALARLEGANLAQWSATPVIEVADRFLRAELLQTLGREEEALGWYASMAERSSDELAYLAPAELRQAEIYDHQGDRGRAAQHYRNFLQLWEAAEPELAPQVERARARLVILSAETVEE
jgi:tetratricopeptide (TPR) repeat protein